MTLDRKWLGWRPVRSAIIRFIRIQAALRPCSFINLTSASTIPPLNLFEDLVQLRADLCPITILHIIVHVASDPTTPPVRRLLVMSCWSHRGDFPPTDSAPVIPVVIIASTSKTLFLSIACITMGSIQGNFGLSKIRFYRNSFLPK